LLAILVTIREAPQRIALDDHDVVVEVCELGLDRLEELRNRVGELRLDLVHEALARDHEQKSIFPLQPSGWRVPRSSLLPTSKICVVPLVLAPPLPEPVDNSPPIDVLEPPLEELVLTLEVAAFEGAVVNGEVSVSDGWQASARPRAAGRSFRGEVNLYLGEVLTHSRKDDVLAFLMNAPREWGARSELLLDADPLIPSLVARSFPVGPWVDRDEEISKRVADDNKQWSTWLAARLEQVGQTSAVVADRVFGVVETVGKGVGEASADSARVSAGSSDRSARVSARRR
jgi:hypothetical protein